MKAHVIGSSAFTLFVLLLSVASASAQSAVPPPAEVVQAPGVPPTAQSSLPSWTPSSYTLNGYVETAYTYAFQNPSNGIIDYRGFDNRHNTFTIQNAVLDAAGKLGPLSARIAVQIGRTPDTYYLSEPYSAGSAGTPGSSLTNWRYIQQVYAGYKTNKVAKSLAIEMGIFLSPIGYEQMAVKDDWNFSRSNLFYGLPFYHTGARITLEATDRTTIMFMVCNGWNSIVDSNSGKSIVSQIQYKIPDRLSLSLLYMGGPERAKDAPEGQPWRHLVDGTAQFDATKWLSFAVEASAGLERNRYGTSTWEAAAIYARAQPVSWLYLAARQDIFAEQQGHNSQGTASWIFFPTGRVNSTTFTIDGRPHDNVSVRLEYRRDQAASDIYFTGNVKGAGTADSPFLPNAKAQNTLTLGATAWF